VKGIHRDEGGGIQLQVIWSDSAALRCYCICSAEPRGFGVLIVRAMIRGVSGYWRDVIIVQGNMLASACRQQ
jgi:hypothetical protein